MVTAELAVGVLSCVVLLVLLAGGLSLVGVRWTNQAVAAETASLLARGDEAAAEELRRRSRPVQVSAVPGPGEVVVTARQEVSPWGSWGPELSVTATATALWEPGEPGR